MKSFSIKKKNITKVLYSGVFLGISFIYVSLCSATDGNFGNLTVNNSMGIGGFAPTTTQGIFSNHQNYGAGNSNIYGYRAGGSGLGGSSWDVNGVESVFKGYSSSPDPYSAAIAAYAYLSISQYPAAAVVACGSRNAFNPSAILGYQENALSKWAGYFIGDAKVTGSLSLGNTPGQMWFMNVNSNNGNCLVLGPDLLTSPPSCTFPGGVNITRNGNLGIGILPGTTNKLDVNGNAAIKGTLTTNAITVTATISPWPDFVFNKNYKARPLSETESYIKKNGRLPGMPSKKDVAKNGINVGEMQAKMLKTIEEMTLQMIELKKENTLLAVEIKELKKDVK
jgi:hypothetical protein